MKFSEGWERNPAGFPTGKLPWKPCGITCRILGPFWCRTIPACQTIILQETNLQDLFEKFLQDSCRIVFLKDYLHDSYRILKDSCMNFPIGKWPWKSCGISCRTSYSCRIYFLEDSCRIVFLKYYLHDSYRILQDSCRNCPTGSRPENSLGYPAGLPIFVQECCDFLVRDHASCDWSDAPSSLVNLVLCMLPQTYTF